MSSAHSPAYIATISLAQVILQACGAAGNPALSAIRREDWEWIARQNMPNPSAFKTAEEFAYAYQSYNLLRKFDSFPVKIDRRERAFLDFDDSEVKCGQINREVDALPYVPGVPLGFQQQSFVELAKSLISKALGKFDWVEFQASCDFSDGASTRCRRNASTPIDKLAGKPHVTINCRDLAVHYMWCNEAWRKHCQDLFGRESDPYSWVTLVPGSKFSTVPKDSLKDRPICVEPDLNMFFQKGIGSMIRRRLARRMIDLNDQTTNQRLARVGSIDNRLATIDLSGASDSVSLRVVEMLVPEDWFQAMLITRSAYVLVDKTYRRLEKISSMGNGFTFELESLIFWALARAVHVTANPLDTRPSVYGDDIIVDSTSAGYLIPLLQSLGFETNKNKTFVEGPFRESCGKHYFLGVDVSPFFIKEIVENWSDLYHVCNSYVEWGWSANVDAFIDLALRPIPPSKRCFVPLHFGSRAGLRGDFRHKWRWCRKTFSYSFKYMREDRSDHTHNGPVAYLGGLLLSEQRGPGEYSAGKKGAGRFVLVKGKTSRW